jgi:hypothetical protein
MSTVDDPSTVNAKASDITTDRADDDDDQDTRTKSKPDGDAEVLSLMRKRLRQCINAEEHYRTDAIDDAKFRAGTWGSVSYQWPSGIQQARTADGRPCLTINRMPAFIRQVTNAARAAHLEITVNPVDDQSDPKVAEVLQGTIRNIEINSFADRAYAMASDKQAEQGRGYIRILKEWSDPEHGFKQRLKIKREKNPLAIYSDPTAQEMDASDADWQMKVTDIDRDAFKDITGKDAPLEGCLDELGSAGDETGDWFPNGKVRWVEYFSREPRGDKKHLALLSTGKEITYPDEKQQKELEKLGITIKMDRWVQPKKFIWRKCDAVTIHEETTWDSKAPPWIPVLGDELQIEGELDFRGVVRDSKSSGQIYNVQVSALTESVGVGQKMPVVGLRGQFGAPESAMRRAWETASTKVHAFLEVEPMDIDGKPAPKPEPMSFEQPLEGIALAIRQTDQDYKSTAGFQDASLGERGPQESGKAILARQKQDELGSSHYLDNLRFALCAVGRQLVDLIRSTYDVPTILRINGKSDQARKVMVFSGARNDPRLPQYRPMGPDGKPVPFNLPDGVKEIYDLSLGEFDIEVSAGPTSGTRRQEAVEAMSALFERLPPEVTTKYLDLYFQMMDFPMGQQMAERAKLMLPPELQQENIDPNIPPQTQAEINQLKQENQQLKQAGQKLQQQLATEQPKYDALQRMKQTEVQGKTQETQMETQSRERINQATLAANERLQAMKQRANYIERQLELKAERAVTLLEAELEHLKTTGDQQHDRTTMTRTHVQDLTAQNADNKAQQDRELLLQEMKDATSIEVARIGAKAQLDAAAAAREEQLATEGDEGEVTGVE